MSYTQDLITSRAIEKLAGIFDSRVQNLMKNIAPKFQEGVYNKLSPELQQFMNKGLGSKITARLGPVAAFGALSSAPVGALAGLYHTYASGGEGDSAPGFTDYLKNSLIGAGVSSAVGAATPAALKLYINNSALKSKLKHMEEDFLNNVSKGEVSHYLKNNEWVDRWKEKYGI